MAPYLEAVEDFLAEVCNLPEVRCVTFAELSTYLLANKDKVKGFQKGQFEKLAAGGTRTQSVGLGASEIPVDDPTADDFPAITEIPGVREECNEH